MLARFAAMMLVVLTTLVLAGCGGEDSTSDDTGDSGSDAAMSDGASQTLELGVDGNKLAFDETELTAEAGTITIKLNNTSSIQHNVGIEDEDGESVGEEGELVGADETSETTVELEPGTYTYYCSPHQSSGMVGTLTVT